MPVGALRFVKLGAGVGLEGADGATLTFQTFDFGEMGMAVVAIVRSMAANFILSNITGRTNPSFIFGVDRA